MDGKCTLAALWIGILVAFPIAAQDKDNTAVRPSEIDGRWRIEWSEFDGERTERPADDATAVMRFEDGHVHHDETKTPYSIDATTDPKLIDFDLTNDPNFNRKLEGIYKLDGDSLIICVYISDVANVRPTDFTTQPGSKRVAASLKRVKE